MNNMKMKRNTAIVVIVLVLSVLASMTAGVAFADFTSITTQSELHSQDMVINRGEESEHYYEVYFAPSDEFTSFTVDVEFPSFVSVGTVITNYELGSDNDGYVGSMTGPNAGSFMYDLQGNRLRVTLTSTQPIYSNTKLFSVEIISNYNATQTGNVRVKYCQFIDSDEKELPVSYNLGSITVNEEQRLGVMGDMDGDEDVDLVDLVTVQRSITDLSGDYALNVLQTELADINGDDIIDIVDCQLIREYIAGILDSLENYGKPNKPIEPENPEEPTEYMITVWRIETNGTFANCGSFGVNPGESLVNSLRNIAENEYGATNVVAFYYDSSFTEQIPESYLADKDMTVWVMLTSNLQPQTYELNLYFDGVWMQSYTATEGDNVLNIVNEQLSYLGEFDGIYYDYEKFEAVGFEDAVYQNRDIYVFSAISEGPAQKHQIAIYINNKYGWDAPFYIEGNDGETIYQALLNNNPEFVDSYNIYYDSEMQMPVGAYDIINQDVDLYLYSQMQNPDPDQIYTISMFMSNDYGEWNHFRDVQYENGSMIWDAIYALQAEKIFVEEAYLDTEKTNVIGRMDTLTDNISIYIVAKDMNTETYDIELYRNYSIDGDFQPFGMISVVKEADIYATIRGMYPFVESIYYDREMTQLVEEGACVEGNVTLYLYSLSIEEENKEKMLSVDIRNSDNDMLDCVQIKIEEGQYILETLKHEFGVQSITAFYMQGGYEEWIAVGEDDMFTKESCQSITVYGHKLDVTIKDGNAMYTEFHYSYILDGQNIEMSVHELFSNRELPYSINGIYFDEAMNEMVDSDALADGDLEVFVDAQNKYAQPDTQCTYQATLVEMLNVPTYVGGFDGSTTPGKNIIDSISEEATNKAGVLYSIVGYYKDSACTQPISVDDVFVQGSNNVYVLIQLKDISGTYTIFDMNMAQVGTLALTNDKGATLTFGDEEPKTGEWSVAQGMLFVNQGAYNQYIFAIMDTQSAMLYMSFIGENEQVEAKYQAFAGEYVYREDAYEDGDGLILYNIKLYANGVSDVNVMGVLWRSKYEVVVEGKVIAIDFMGNVMYFDVDVENETLEANELARFVGTTELYSDDKVLLGSVTINYDGSATAPVDGVQKEGTIKYESSNLYFYYGEYDLLVISCNNNDKGELINFRLDYSFQGSDYEENSAFEAYVGEYELQMHGDTLNTIEFMSNGTFYMYGDKFMTVYGRYEITDTGLTIYYFDSEDWRQEIVYDETTERYILKDLMMNQNGGTVTTNPEYKYE